MANSVKNENGGGSIYQHGGKWIAKITDVDGKRKTRTCKSENIAKRALRELLAERERRAAGEIPVAANLTVGTMLDIWWNDDFLARMPSPVKGTRDAYGYCVINLKKVLGNRRAATLAVHEVTDAFKILAAMGRTSDGVMSRSYLSRHRNILSQAFDFAVAQERLMRNPATQVKLPRTARPEQRRKSFDLEQHAAFLASASEHRWGALFILGATLGLRPGELGALCWDKVDLDAGTIEVARGARLTDEGRGISDRLKTDGSFRKLRLPGSALVALHAHKVNQAANDLATGLRSDLVFRTSHGTLINPSNLAKEMRRITVAAGLGDNWMPYELRHTAASVLNDRGVPLELIADLLGNKDTRMLAKHYRHRLNVVIDVAVGPMDDLANAGASAC